MAQEYINADGDRIQIEDKDDGGCMVTNLDTGTWKDYGSEVTQDVAHDFALDDHPDVDHDKYGPSDP